MVLRTRSWGRFFTSSKYLIAFEMDEFQGESIKELAYKYLGNNSNTSNVINNLPLSEYGYTFELDSTDLGIIINYHITDWYINENYYLEKSLIYNSVSIFSLIENTKYIIRRCHFSIKAKGQ